MKKVERDMPYRSRALVVTTINHPTRCLQLLAKGAAANSCPLIVAGDAKTPADFYLAGANFCGLSKQVDEFPGFTPLLPLNHYVRKNVGYLFAMQSGADEIQETDDDNYPLEAFWRPIAGTVVADRLWGKGPWFNVYSLFSDKTIWPRGLPLEFIHASSEIDKQTRHDSSALIVQSLANDNPDVDAVYRLTRPLPISFSSRRPVELAPGTWCPFNSQNTLFRRRVFPLLYLPTHCSFRMTDIWRSFVAQRCLWELGHGVIFEEATMVQDRNEHCLLKDFSLEIDGYLNNDRIRRALDEVKLDAVDICGNVVRCYEALIAIGLLHVDELKIIKGWNGALERLSIAN